MKESEIEQACVDLIKEKYPDALFPKTAWLGNRGGPDRMLILPNRPTIFVEIKTPSGQLSASQVALSAKLRCMGQLYWVIRDAANFDLYIKSILSHRGHT